MSLVKKVYETQIKVDESLKKLGKGKYGRVVKLSRKPTSDEFKKVLLVTGAGILIIGGAGFLVYWLWNNLYASMRSLLGL
ncbi:MAG: protein translocase SEC61 complex subunit gamma [Candidatus Thermoplasmatota archaeon]|nr:protein translocase SEC61 complex subunit gamma [Candidatus Thermoplasmatota archaeon]MDI6855712.1 protein translocase SEC61 complex subunit gamma [Candidatus Thermoplasmatota archaeon]